MRFDVFSLNLRPKLSNTRRICPIFKVGLDKQSTGRSRPIHRPARDSRIASAIRYSDQRFDWHHKQTQWSLLRKSQPLLVCLRSYFSILLHKISSSRRGERKKGEMDENEMWSKIKHRRIRPNGIEMHVAEIGAPTCPLVLLLHGFPELWFSWRHQMIRIAEHGYHVVAPDMRGYGDTESPADSFSYTILHLLGDLIGLLDSFDREKAFVVGHDWGAEVGWHLGLMRPDRVKALVCLSVPFRARSPGERPTETFARMLGDGFHVSQFQEPGRAEKAFARYDYYTIMKKFLSIRKPDLIAPPGVELIDFLETPSSLPAWITEEEIQYFATKFQKSGFTGPLNYYRAMDRNWELLAPWDGAKIDVPTKFITGDKDIGFQSFGTKDYILGDAFKSLVPNVEVVIIDGHHYIQQENADVVTNEILSFFSNVCIA